MKNRTTITAVLLLFCAAAAFGAVQRTVATGQEIQNPQVAVAGTGDYMVVWSDLTRAQDYDVFARLFEASGKPQGGAFVASRSIHGWPRTSGAISSSSGKGASTATVQVP
jgi:hypothetical protein